MSSCSLNYIYVLHNTYYLCSFISRCMTRCHFLGDMNILYYIYPPYKYRAIVIVIGEGVGGGGDPLSQILAGQLSLFQSGEVGQIMTTTLLLSPSPNFQTFLRPCHILHIYDFSLLTVWPSENAVFAR